MKIVVGALRSVEGEAALRAAADEASLRSARVLLVAHVPTPLDQRTSLRYEEQRRAAEATAAELAAPLRDRGLDVNVHLPTGADSPAEAILSVARDEQADLIVIGVRRRSRVGKLVLGSNAQDILLGAEAAVLAVKPGADEGSDLEG